MKILVFGAINLDMVYAVDHIVFPGEILSSNDYSVHTGGKGANQACALVKAGIPVYFAGKIGKDGKWVLDILAKFGVRTEHVLVLGEGLTGRAIIQVDKQG